jgi:hypothetical protein
MCRAIWSRRCKRQSRICERLTRFVLLVPLSHTAALTIHLLQALLRLGPLTESLAVSLDSSLSSAASLDVRPSVLYCLCSVHSRLQTRRVDSLVPPRCNSTKQNIFPPFSPTSPPSSSSNSMAGLPLRSARRRCGVQPGTTWHGGRCKCSGVRSSCSFDLFRD